MPQNKVQQTCELSQVLILLITLLTITYDAINGVLRSPYMTQKQ